MRVLRLELPGATIDLHPYVTVVRGLPPEARAQLLEALAAIPSGKALAPGLVEAFGVLLDLDDAGLDLLDLHADIDPVVRRTDLPGSAGARRTEAERAVADAEADATEADARVERAIRAVEGARDALRAARDTDGTSADPLAEQRADLERRVLARADAERRLGEAVAAERSAAVEVLSLEAAADAAREARADATRALSLAAAALEGASARRDPMAGSVLEVARSRLADAEALAAAVQAADEGDGDDVVTAEGEVGAAGDEHDEDEVAHLHEARVAAAAAVLAVDTVDPSPVRLAVEQLRAGGAIEPVPDPRAIELAERWAALEAELAVLTEADDVDDDLEGGDHRHAARERLRAAEAAVASAVAAIRPRSIDPADARALEEAHAALLDARDGLDRRLGRRAAARRVAESAAAEQELLRKLGFATFTDYLIGFGEGGHRDPAAGDRLDAARTELLAASAAAEEIDAAVAEELRRAELLDQRRRLRDEAVELLGVDPGDDVAGALRRRRIPATETGGHLTRLRAALEATGLVLEGEELPERVLVDLAAVWLDEQEEATVERAVLEQRVSDVDARLAAATRRRAFAAANEAERDGSTPRPSRLTAALAAVDDARRAVAAAEARVAAQREVEAELEIRRAALEEAAAQEAHAIAAIAEAEAACADARIAERHAAALNRDAEQALAAARAAEDAARELLAGLEERLTAAEDRIGRIEDDLARASVELAEARTEADRASATLEAARARLAALDDEELDVGAADEQRTAAAEDAEWYLLARLAAQRAVSFAGSVPLVLDDTLVGIDVDPARRLLDRLERMAATVQVVLVTEELGTAAWAESLGPTRAAVVSG